MGVGWGIRNNEEKVKQRGKGESCMEKMRWKRMLHDERKFCEIIAGGVEELACHQKTFQPTIPDSQGQVSSNKKVIS